MIYRRIHRFSTFALCRRLLAFGAPKGQEKGNVRPRTPGRLSGDPNRPLPDLAIITQQDATSTRPIEELDSSAHAPVLVAENR